MTNRMRQLRSSGSVRDEGGNVLIYSDASAATRCPLGAGWLCPLGPEGQRIHLGVIKRARITYAKK